MTDYGAWDLLLPPDEHGAPHRRAVRARGHRIDFADGASVLDATSGLWNVNLGYGNRAIAEAVAEALVDASYLTMFRYGHEYARAAAAELLAAAGADRYSRVLFSTSGSAANDATMKLARQYAVLRKEPERRIVVGLKDSYHGQTYGSFALSGDDLGQELYGADRRLIRHVDRADPDDLNRLLEGCGREVAAVVVEPVLGTGAHALPAMMIDALLAARRRYGFLLVCDEVATGFGRTGTLFASQRWAEAPDVLLTSKGLTNGTCAAAAILISDAVREEFGRTGAVLVHGETQAGTPASCAAITATLRQFEALGALDTGRRNASALADGLRVLAGRDAMVAEVTGAGCFLGLHLRMPTGAPLWAHHVTQVIEAIRVHGVLVHPGPSAIQIVPALTFTPPEITEVLDAVEAGLADFAAARAAKRNRQPHLPQHLAS
jgi:adenosylmethionine-8-amino-7-oxononanoate aminotransferase